MVMRGTRCATVKPDIPRWCRSLGEEYGRAMPDSGRCSQIQARHRPICVVGRHGRTRVLLGFGVGAHTGAAGASQPLRVAGPHVLPTRWVQLFQYTSSLASPSSLSRRGSSRDHVRWSSIARKDSRSSFPDSRHRGPRRWGWEYCSRGPWSMCQVRRGPSRYIILPTGDTKRGPY